jgi:N-acetylneuraminate synthase
MCRLGNITVLKERFASDRISIGYSGHEQGIAVSFAAINLGAEMVERHFCVSRHSFAHHIECSLEPQEFRQLVEFSKPEYRVRRQSYCQALPKETFDVHFGMSDLERDFLEDQKYGTKYLGDGSEMR